MQRLIKVRVYPDSQENAVIEHSPDTYDVYVRAHAQHNHANTLASYLLSRHFSCGVKLISGGTRQHKIFKVFPPTAG